MDRRELKARTDTIRQDIKALETQLATTYVEGHYWLNKTAGGAPAMMAALDALARAERELLTVTALLPITD